MAGGLLVLALLAVAGCQPEVDPMLDLADSEVGTQQLNDLDRTMLLASSDASYDYRQYEEKISGGLNRWIRKTIEDGGAGADDSKQWSPDPLVQPLNMEYASIPATIYFDKREFVSTDPYFIRERRWMNLIAARVCDSGILPIELTRLQAMIGTGEGTTVSAVDVYRKFYPEMPEDALTKLAESALLFDWVTRNIQLEEPLKIDDSNVEEYSLVDGDGLEYAARGVPGLGYRRFLWQVLIYGRADYVERAKLFAGLCRQRGIDSAMMTIGDRPWAVAVLIDGRAWMFDTRLGLPIPGNQLGQIATLADIKNSPELLKQLDLSVEETNRDDSRYWVTAEDLGNLKGQVFASPESVSRRMKFLQNRLLGEQQLILTEEPSATAGLLAASFPDLPVSVSPVAWQTHIFRKLVGEARKRAIFDEVTSAKLDWYFSEESYIDEFVDYRSARNLFFIGRFETQRNSRKLSAAEGFYTLMYPDDMIVNVGLDIQRLNRLGIFQQTGQSPLQFQQRLQGVQMNMRLVRRDAGIFLAQSLFDNGNVSSAANWLYRIKENDEAERWIPAMKYLEARSLESSGDYDSAIRIYREIDGAQFLGCVLRARLLSQAIAAAGLDKEPAGSDTPESGKDEKAGVDGI